MKYLNIDYVVDEIRGYNDSMEFCDMAIEIADSFVDIYNSVLLNWLKDEPDAIEAMNEVCRDGLVDTRDYDLYKHIQVAQFNLYYMDILENENEIMERLSCYIFIDYVKLNSYKK